MASEDKTFELMEKMYVEVQKGFENVNNRMDKVEQNQARLENKFDTKITALFDGYSQLNEKTDRIEYTVNDIAQKVNNQEVEIRVLKAVK